MPASFTAPRDNSCMNAIILIVSVVLPLLPIVLFPTRFFGRGTGMTLLGAGLLVGMMMLVYWSLSGLTATDTTSSDADISALAKMF